MFQFRRRRNRRKRWKKSMFQLRKNLPRSGTLKNRRKKLKKFTNRKTLLRKADTSLAIGHAPAIDAGLATVVRHGTGNLRGIGNRHETNVDRARLSGLRIAARNVAAHRGTNGTAMDATGTMSVNVREVHPASKSPRQLRNLLTMALFQSFNQS